jgi:hypothetical protein
MVATGRRTTIRHRSEEAGALVSAVLALTASAAAIIAVFHAVSGTVPVVALPAAAILVALAARREQAALWAATAAWVVITPLAHGNGILAPMLMVALTAAFAIGPDRALAWIAHDWSGSRPDDESPASGWIEEEPRIHGI